jgi:hypothetical protein
MTRLPIAPNTRVATGQRFLCLCPLWYLSSLYTISVTLMCNAVQAFPRLLPLSAVYIADDNPFNIVPLFFRLLLQSHKSTSCRA